MVGLRLLSPQFDITFAAMLDIVAWTDIVTSFVVYTASHRAGPFVSSAYLDRLCEHLFVTRGVNLGSSRAAFAARWALP